MTGTRAHPHSHGGPGGEPPHAARSRRGRAPSRRSLGGSGLPGEVLGTGRAALLGLVTSSQPGTPQEPTPRLEDKSCDSSTGDPARPPAAGEEPGPRWPGPRTGTKELGRGMSCVPSGHAENGAHRGGLSPGTPPLAEPPVGGQQSPRCHQASGWRLCSQHVSCQASGRSRHGGWAGGTRGSWGWDLPQLLRPWQRRRQREAQAAVVPWTLAAPRDGLPPPAPGSRPTDPPTPDGCSSPGPSRPRAG